MWFSHTLGLVIHKWEEYHNRRVLLRSGSRSPTLGSPRLWAWRRCGWADHVASHVEPGSWLPMGQKQRCLQGCASDHVKSLPCSSHMPLGICARGLLCSPVDLQPQHKAGHCSQERQQPALPSSAHNGHCTRVHGHTGASQSTQLQWPEWEQAAGNTGHLLHKATSSKTGRYNRPT